MSAKVYLLKSRIVNVNKNVKYSQNLQLSSSSPLEPSFLSWYRRLINSDFKIRPKTVPFDQA